MTYTITKTFEGVDLAHRVDTQQLDCEFTEGCSSELRCRRNHGHTASILVKLSSEKLVNHMVMDYNELGFMKKLIKDHLDHHSLYNINDPIFKHIAIEPYKSITGDSEIRFKEKTEYSTDAMKMSVIDLNETLMTDEDMGAWFRAMTVVNFPTTSENICCWLFGIIKKKVDLYNARNGTNVKLEMVGYKETASSLATYSEG